jgi:hypothetical protein
VPASRQIAELDAVVVSWLTRLLLDQGAMGFERNLANIDLPRWASAEEG